jgi:hypothetical protein
VPSVPAIPVVPTIPSAATRPRRARASGSRKSRGYGRLSIEIYDPQVVNIHGSTKGVSIRRSKSKELGNLVDHQI